MEHFDKSEVREIEIDNKDYPELLKGIQEPPKALRIRGNLPPNRKIIAISGSRKTTKQALETADRIGKMLAQQGYTIVTGLAHGCDAAAVEGALSAGGKVIGVVPWGLKSLREPTKELAHKIFATGGGVISEYPDDLSKIFNRHYLRRNEIITGLSEKNDHCRSGRAIRIVCNRKPRFKSRTRGYYHAICQSENRGRNDR